MERGNSRGRSKKRGVLVPDRWLMNYSYGNNIIVGIEGGGDEIKRAEKNGDVDFGFAQRRIKEKGHKKM